MSGSISNTYSLPFIYVTIVLVSSRGICVASLLSPLALSLQHGCVLGAQSYVSVDVCCDCLNWLC